MQKENVVFTGHEECEAQMTFDEIWKQLCEKRPGLIDPDAHVQITSGKFKELLEVIYWHGRESATGNKDTVHELFRTFFGR